MKNNVTIDSVCVPSKNIVAREIEGDIVIVPIVANIGDIENELYTLNETGKAIWLLLDEHKTLGQVVLYLENEFSTSVGDIERDVLGFAEEMVRWGMLTIIK